MTQPTDLMPVPASTAEHVWTDLDERCVHTIRFLAVDAVQKANSGHPGMPMGAATMAYVLWSRFLKHNPKNPGWFNRDRFILSAGHGSMLLYALLHLTGYDLPLEELQNFRQWGSRTPGHPEYGLTPGVEITTGPLGQGFATGVGMAMAERMLAARFNRPGHPVIDHYTYGIVSDGDLMEGVSAEAASLAGHLGLGKLIYLYDDNHISIDGSTDLSFTEDVLARFAAYGWHVQRVTDGNDPAAIEAAIRVAQAQGDQPSLIAVRTHIGYGSPNKQDSAAAHGAPLGVEEVRRTKERFNWPLEPAFYIPENVREAMGQTVERGQRWQQEWEAALTRYGERFPAEAAELARWMAGDLPADWDADLPTFPADGAIAIRAASGQVLNGLAARLPNLVGGSADLTGSNNTHIQNGGTFQRDEPTGRNLHFGVREHAMAAALNGMSLHGGLFVYGGTFLVFSDYMRGAMRLSALMHQGVVYVLTHDSIGLGEDGPTHQPVEHLATLRAMPNMTVIRPADGNEVVEAWRLALQRRHGPTALILSRQKLPILDREVMAPAEGLRRGAYVLMDPPDGQTPQAILMASGSEVSLVVEAARQLAAEGVPVRVVSFPSWELFAEQPEAYRQSVLPDDIPLRVAVEAGSTLGWDRWVGCRGAILGLDRFGASAPGPTLYQAFGFTAERIVQIVKNL